MSKFKVGDLVVCIDDGDSMGMLVKGQTYRVSYIGDDLELLELSNDNEYEWYVERFELAEQQHTHYECPYAIIEELEAHNESLEETVVALTKEVLELRKNVASQTATFKPISEMTKEDWELAVNEGWVFELRNGRATVVIGVDDDPDSYYPVDTANGWLALDGREWDYSTQESPYDIIKRIK